jgi:hypothetical protein
MMDRPRGEERMRAFGVVGSVVLVAGGCTFHVGALAETAAPTDVVDLALAAPSDMGGGPGDDPRPPGPDMVVVVAPPPTGALTLATMAVTAARDVDLTADGTRDWMHWGFATAIDSDRDADGDSQIGGFAVVGKNKPVQYGDNVLGFVWSNGAPPRTSSGGSRHIGVYVTQPGNGFSLTLPADTTMRTAQLYLGGFHSHGHFDAALSDQSSPGVGDESYFNLTGKFDVVYRLDYRAASAGQSITIRWLVLEGDTQSNVTLQAVTLR